MSSCERFGVASVQMLIAATLACYAGFAAQSRIAGGDYAGFVAQSRVAGGEQVAAVEVSEAGQRKQQPPASAPASRLTFGTGDKLKLTFYERLDFEEDKWVVHKHPTKPHLNFNLRTELSGEYVVQSDGTVSLPLLGTFLVANRNSSELNVDLVRAFEQVSGRSGFINIMVVERQPIYIIGPVKHPGSYAYAPGMTVLHAIALAGGFDHGQEDRWSTIEAVRESAKLGSSPERLKRLLAEMAVLRAERDGKPVTIPYQLIELAGAHGAEVLVAEETARRLPVVRAREEREKSLSTEVEGAQHALEFARGRLAPLDASMQMKKDRVNGLLQLASRGHVDKLSVVNAQSELSDIEERNLNVKTAVSDVEERIALARQGKAKFEKDTLAELERGLAVGEREITEVMSSLSASAGVLGIIKPPEVCFGRGLSEANVRFEVVRQTEGGPGVIAANGTMQLHPGDLVRVGDVPAQAEAGLDEAMKISEARQKVP